MVKSYFAQRKLLVAVSALSMTLLASSPLRANTVGMKYGFEFWDSVAGSAQCGSGPLQSVSGAFGTLYSLPCAFNDTSGPSFSGTLEAYAPVWGATEAYTSFQATGTSNMAAGVYTALVSSWSLDTWTNTLSIPVNVTITVSLDTPPGGGISGTYPSSVTPSAGALCYIGGGSTLLPVQYAQNRSRFRQIHSPAWESGSAHKLTPTSPTALGFRPSRPPSTIWAPPRSRPSL